MPSQVSQIRQIISGRRDVERDLPPVEKVIPTYPVPMVDNSGTEVTDITTGFACSLETTLVFSYPVGLGKSVDWASPIVSIIRFEGVNLAEQVKISFVATL